MAKRSQSPITQPPASSTRPAAGRTIVRGWEYELDGWHRATDPKARWLVVGNFNHGVAFPADGEFVTVGRFAMPQTFFYFLKQYDGPRQVAQLRVNGGLKIEALALILEEGQGMTSADIRAVKVETIRELAGVRAGGTLEDGEFVPAAWDESDFTAFADNLTEIRKPQRGHSRPESFYWEVATTYRQALASGRKDPTRAVAETFHGSESSAARWVMIAREKGALGRTTKGLLGEPTRGGKDG